jgi:hypothetical protein
MNAFNYDVHDNHRRVRAKGFSCAGDGVRARGGCAFLAERATLPRFAVSLVGDAGTLLRGMNIMRAIAAAGVLLLTGCTQAMQQQEARYGILRPRYEVTRINGTFEPVVFTIDRARLLQTEERGPCQTNDPMPTGEFRQPRAPMPVAATPSSPAPMPNYCPVTAPATAKSTVVSTPRPPKQVQPATPSEPRP